VLRVADHSFGEYHVVRSFGWGLIMIWDSETDGVPEGPRGATVWVSEDGISIAVRHAQDVDPDPAAEPDDEIELFQVELTIRIWPTTPCGTSPETSDGFETDFEGVLSCPSGVLTVGDADHLEDLRIGPGRWLVRAAWEPKDHPERVEVRLIPAAVDPPRGLRVCRGEIFRPEPCRWVVTSGATPRGNAHSVLPGGRSPGDRTTGQARA
jgi:hypothetical protein